MVSTTSCYRGSLRFSAGKISPRKVTAERHPGLNVKIWRERERQEAQVVLNVLGNLIRGSRHWIINHVLHVCLAELVEFLLTRVQYMDGPKGFLVLMLVEFISITWVSGQQNRSRTTKRIMQEFSTNANQQRRKPSNHVSEGSQTSPQYIMFCGPSRRHSSSLSSTIAWGNSLDC